MTKEALEKRRITQAVQEGSWEYISLLACINAKETAIPPTLIYKSKLHDLQNS